MDAIEKIELLAILEEHEVKGTLVEYVKEHYPEFILLDGSVAKFQLAEHLGLL